MAASSISMTGMRFRTILLCLLAIYAQRGMGMETNKKPAVDEALLFSLAVEEAKRLNLDQQPEVKKRLDNVLYEEYVGRTLESLGTKLEPSEDELKTAYEASPLIRLRHLAVPAESAEKIPKVITVVQDKLKRGAEFQKLVMEYSEDDSAPFGGDTDFRGPHNFPAEFYLATVKLKKGEISQPLYSNGGFHLFQLMDKKSYDEAFPVYRVYLRNELIAERKQALLSDILKSLSSKTEKEAVAKP
jgi:parvulin-like peptidyl-prolyl isomerase